MQKLGKNREDNSNITEDPTPAKIPKLESSSSRNLHGSNLPKQLIKDLRVRVERLSSDSNVETQNVNDATDTKGDVAKTSENEERQVPRLPVAEDEPARKNTSNTCPQGLKKEGSQEDMVTSSCQEPRSKCVLVQTEQIQTDGLPAKVNLRPSASLIFARLYSPITLQLYTCRSKENAELRNNQRQRR